MQEQINLADILIIEANHDEKLIHLSDYHEELIERILSDTGHLVKSANCTSNKRH